MAAIKFNEDGTSKIGKCTMCGAACFDSRARSEIMAPAAKRCGHANAAKAVDGLLAKNLYEKCPSSPTHLHRTTPFRRPLN